MAPDLRSIVSILRSGDKETVAAVAETEGLVEAIVSMIKDPSSPRTTKASLLTAYYLSLASERAASRLVDSGSVSLLLEVLVDAEKSVSEKALGALDAILDNEKGREEACDHELAVPVLVRKMFRVSDAATGFAVSALWKLLCKKRCGCGGGEESRTRLMKAALRAGAFQKVLLLLQLGCSEGTKGKATELLRTLNRCRGDWECVDSADFRGLRRSLR